MRVVLNLLAIVFVAVTVSCGGQTADASSKSTPDKAAAKNAGDGGLANGADGGTERQFAGSAAEATSMISAVVDKKGTGIGMCVRNFRLRKNLARERVSVSFGIDMEGKLLGVTSKGKEDNELKACVQDVLKSAEFPRSNAGVITVTKTYEELVQ